MPITAEQRIARRNAIGSSDMAAILGVNPYATAYDIWLEKTGKLTDEEIKSKAIDAGNRFEAAVLDWAEEELQEPLDRNVSMIRPELHLASNLDAMGKINGDPVEAKTAGLFTFLDKDAWGDPGTDQVPEQYLVQCHVQMILARTDLCHLAAFLGGRGFVMYCIERNEALCDHIIQAAGDFWTRHVMTDLPPDGLPTLEVIKRARRVPKKVVNIAADVAHRFLDAKEKLKAAEEAMDPARRELLAAMGDAEGATCLAGDFTYFEQGRKGIDVGALNAAFPDIAKRFGKESRFRVLRHKDPK